MKLKLSTRLVITIVVIQAVVLSVLFWNNQQTFKHSHIEQQELSYLAEQEHLQKTLSLGLIYADRAMLSESILMIVWYVKNPKRYQYSYQEHGCGQE